MISTLPLQSLAENLHISELFSLRGKVVVVTGGAGRYGRQICRAMGEAGATVVVASRDVSKCEVFASELREQKCDAHALELELTQQCSVLKLVTECFSRWGRVDILFNNAVMVEARTFEDESPEEWARAVFLNAAMLYRACWIVGERMGDCGKGSIVNIGSIYGAVSPDFRIYEGHPEMTNPPSYGFVKAGMAQLTRYLAVYFASRGVRVNCLTPGGLFSPSMPPDFIARYCERTPLGRMAGTNDLKGAAVFLASDASAYITGQNLFVDGGYTAL